MADHNRFGTHIMTRFVPLILVPMLAPFALADPLADQTKQTASDWIRVTPNAAFSPRDTAEDLIFNNKMWISNGYYHGNQLTCDLWSSTDGAEWTRVLDATPYDGYSELVAYQNKMWAVKGSVWNSADGVHWTKILDRTPFGARGYGELVVFNNQLVQLGSGPDVWTSTNGKDWTCINEAAPYGDRAASAVVVHDQKLWLLGGRTPLPNTPPEKGYKDMTTHNDVWSSPDGKTWTRILDHAPWPPRQWFIAKVYRNHIWIIGGHDNVNSKNLADVWHSLDGKTWHEFKSSTSFSPRHEPTVYVHNDHLWVIAGNAWPVTNDVWKLNISR
jgi:hypothetical protein